MKISELKDEKAIYALGEMLVPLSTVFADDDLVEAFKSGQNIKAVSMLLKRHAKETMKILAAADGVPEEEYHCNLLTLPAKVLEIVNAPEVQELFTFAETKTDGAFSISASEKAN